MNPTVWTHGKAGHFGGPGEQASSLPLSGPGRSENAVQSGINRNNSQLNRCFTECTWLHGCRKEKIDWASGCAWHGHPAKSPSGSRWSTCAIPKDVTSLKSSDFLSKKPSWIRRKSTSRQEVEISTSGDVGNTTCHDSWHARMGCHWRWLKIHLGPCKCNRMDPPQLQSWYKSYEK